MCDRTAHQHSNGSVAALGRPCGKFLMRLFCWGLLLLSLAPWELSAQSRAENATAAFEAANKFYEQGRYANAAAAYQELIQDGHVSAPLLFNLGNAYFKAGQPGRAIVSYRLAEQLAGRDRDIQANLQFVREQVNGPAKEGVARVFKLLSLNELTILFTLAYWTWLISLTIATIRSRSNRQLIRFSGFAAVLLGLWLVAAWTFGPSARQAVVIAPEAIVRYGPLEESQSYYTLPDGAEVAVLERKDQWLKIEDSRGRVGWVRSAEAGFAIPETLLDSSNAERGRSSS